MKFGLKHRQTGYRRRRNERIVILPKRNVKTMKPSKATTSAKPQTLDQYLGPLTKDKRAALEKLRKDIKSAAPRAEECISYGVPAFRLDGTLLVAFGAAA